jgi:hypothetical protein
LTSIAARSCVVGASGDEHVHGTESLVVARVLAQYQRHESRARKASPFVFGACTCAHTVYCRGSPGLTTTPKNEGIKQAQAVACASLEYCTTLPLRPNFTPSVTPTCLRCPQEISERRGRVSTPRKAASPQSSAARLGCDEVRLHDIACKTVAVHRP